MQTNNFNIVKKRLILLCWCFGLLCLSACSPTAINNRDIDLNGQTDSVAGLDENADLKQTGYQSQYYISPGDILEIKFPYRPEMNDQYVVRPDGRIPLPFAGSEVAAGKTPEELQEVVNDRYQTLSLNYYSTNQAGKEYRVQVGDHLAIKFSNATELDELVVVRPDGKVSLPIVGTVVVENQTPEQLSTVLKKKFSDFVHNPDPVVMVQEVSSDRFFVNGVPVRNRFKNLEDAMVLVRDSTPMRIFVGGEVASPGFFPYTGRLSALQAIIMAGGERSSADMRQVAVIRKGGSQGAKLFLRNLKTDVTSNEGGRLHIEDAALGDVTLRPYDVVIVPKTSIAKVTDYVDQYLYTLIPALRNISFSFVYDINPVDRIESVNTTK